mmetsp:Transcript_116813/g.371796  ORF Transcript_116813/g.371796 Transcript_116813/m.371796 type:complete len:275 (-) Transcript_116813:599-1423(-)
MLVDLGLPVHEAPKLVAPAQTKEQAHLLARDLFFDIQVGVCETLRSAFQQHPRPVIHRQILKSQDAEFPSIELLRAIPIQNGQMTSVHFELACRQRVRIVVLVRIPLATPAVHAVEEASATLHLRWPRLADLSHRVQPSQKRCLEGHHATSSQWQSRELMPELHDAHRDAFVKQHGGLPLVAEWNTLVGVALSDGFQAICEPVGEDLGDGQNIHGCIPPCSSTQKKLGLQSDVDTFRAHIHDASITSVRDDDGTPGHHAVWPRRVLARCDAYDS